MTAPSTLRTKDSETVVKNKGRERVAKDKGGKVTEDGSTILQTFIPIEGLIYSIIQIIPRFEPNFFLDLQR